MVFRVSYDLTPEQAEEYHKQMDEIINGWEETGEIITNVKNVDGEKAVQVSEKNEEIEAEKQTSAEEIYDKMKYEADEQAKSLGFDNSMAEVVSDEFENSYGFVRGLEEFSGNEGEDLARFLIAISYFELNFDEGTLGNAVGEKGWEAIKSLIFDDGEFQSKMDEMKELYEAGGNRLFESSYNEGQYKVGEDIPSGEYVLFADYSVAYFAITEDSNAENIISNGNFEYNSIICVNDGEYLELSMCKAVPIEEVDDLPIDNANMFKVGTHLPAGEYKLVSDSDIGYYAIYNDSRHQDIVSNNNFQSQSYVIVEDGQYLLLSMCHIETK